MKGVSPLIATVLLIGFVIALVAVVMLWGKSFIMEKAAKEGSLSQKQLDCVRIEIDVKKEGENYFVINKGREQIDGMIIRQGTGIIQCPKDKACGANFPRPMKELDRYLIPKSIPRGSGDEIDLIPACFLKVLMHH